MEQENTTQEKDSRQTRKERCQLWKDAKKRKREEKKEFYRYAPWPRKVWGLYLKIPVAIIIVIAIMGLFIYERRQAIYNCAMDTVWGISSRKSEHKILTEEDKELIYELSPIDEEGAGVIDSMPGIGKDETWTICVYMVASDLEDRNVDNLSELAAYEADSIKSMIQSDSANDSYEAIENFKYELEENSLEFPAFFYEPNIPVPESVMDELYDGWNPEANGDASEDISEMTADTWPENVKIVIQTGGARKWDNQMINPNRTQRFLYHNGQFKEVSDMAMQPAADSKTLADFISFCDTEYPSDHRMLVLWNHGGGPFGYGYDSVFGGHLTLNDIREALSDVYKPDINNAPFDIIGFDACLMSTIEVTHALHGFADYYCLSEEMEPGDGWDYTTWLTAMANKQTLNAAQVGKEIADSYMDYYIANNIRYGENLNNVTFSVIDAAAAEKLYGSYNEFAKKLLKDAAGDISVLATAGRCANNSTRYGGAYHGEFNTIDLGNYVNLMIDEYPDECSRIRKLIDEAVLYHRENGCLEDSTGIAVYFPAQVDTLNGLLYYLDYHNGVCENEDVRTLYYYKQAGCLTDEMRKYVATLTDKVPQNLDISLFRKFTGADPKFDEAGFLIPVDDELSEMIVDSRMELIYIDEKKEELIDYGMDKAVKPDGEGHLTSDFGGEWIHLNDVPLYVEVVSTTGSAIEYKAHVSYDQQEAYLLISRDLDTDELSLMGVRVVNNDTEVMAASRSTMELENGASIEPIYYVIDMNTGSETAQTGKKVTYNDWIDLSFEPIRDGRYLATAVISDQRGDSYYSEVMGFTAYNGIPRDWHEEPGF